MDYYTCNTPSFSIWARHLFHHVCSGTHISTPIIHKHNTQHKKRNFTGVVTPRPLKTMVYLCLIIFIKIKIHHTSLYIYMYRNKIYTTIITMVRKRPSSHYTVLCNFLQDLRLSYIFIQSTR